MANYYTYPTKKAKAHKAKTHKAKAHKAKVHKATSPKNPAVRAKKRTLS